MDDKGLIPLTQGPSNRKVFLSRNYEINWNQGISYRNWGSFTLWFQSRHMKIFENKRPTQRNKLFSHISLSLLYQAQWSVCFFLLLGNLLIAKQAESLALTLLQCTKILGSVQRCTCWNWSQPKCTTAFFLSSFSLPAPGCVLVAWQPICCNSWCQLVFT